MVFLLFVQIKRNLLHVFFIVCTFVGETLNLYLLFINYCNEKNNCMCCFCSNDCFPNERIGKRTLHGSH